MKSFSPAGMAVKGYYGRGARTFGNPDGATRGGGAYAQGGDNPNGPNQGGGGGGGTAVTFQVQQSTNSSGPYLVPNNTSLILGITRSPIPSPLGVSPLGVITPDPVLVNGQTLQVVGSVGIGPTWYYTVCLNAVVPQAFFTDMTFQTVGGSTVVLTTATADFNGLFTGVGFSIWDWAMPFTGLPQDLLADNSNIVITWP